MRWFFKRHFSRFDVMSVAIILPLFLYGYFITTGVLIVLLSLIGVWVEKYSNLDLDTR